MGETALTKQSVKENSASLFSDEAALMNAEEWLVQIDYAANKPSSMQEKAKNNLAEVKGLLRNLLPEVAGIRIDPPDSNRPQPNVKVETPYVWVPVQSLSIGYRTMIAWMVDLARRMYERYPDSLRPLAEPAIVLIDEIDLHLHPQWQRNLMSYLGKYFENTQFIVTAHSPLVVQAAANANLVLLKKKEKQNYVEIINEVTKIRGWRVDQILTSDLFGLPSARPPELDDLLEQRRKILEKPTLTEDDEKELAQLQAQIGELAGGETKEDIEAIDIIHRAAKVLKELEQTIK
jgi:predicted ATP-binding protein involved in virulence